MKSGFRGGLCRSISKITKKYQILGEKYFYTAKLHTKIFTKNSTRAKFLSHYTGAMASHPKIIPGTNFGLKHYV